MAAEKAPSDITSKSTIQCRLLVFLFLFEGPNSIRVIKFEAAQEYSPIGLFKAQVSLYTQI